VEGARGPGSGRRSGSREWEALEVQGVKNAGGPSLVGQLEARWYDDATNGVVSRGAQRRDADRSRARQAGRNQPGTRWTEAEPKTRCQWRSGANSRRKRGPAVPAWPASFFTPIPKRRTFEMARCHHTLSAAEYGRSG
jgi:hypothetical protein